MASNFKKVLVAKQLAVKPGGALSSLQPDISIT